MHRFIPTVLVLAVIFSLLFWLYPWALKQLSDERRGYQDNIEKRDNAQRNAANLGQVAIAKSKTLKPYQEANAQIKQRIGEFLNTEKVRTFAVQQANARGLAVNTYVVDAKPTEMSLPDGSAVNIRKFSITLTGGHQALGQWLSQIESTVPNLRVLKSQWYPHAKEETQTSYEFAILEDIDAGTQ